MSHQFNNVGELPEDYPDDSSSGTYAEPADTDSSPSEGSYNVQELNEWAERRERQLTRAAAEEGHRRERSVSNSTVSSASSDSWCNCINCSPEEDEEIGGTVDAETQTDEPFEPEVNGEAEMLHIRLERLLREQ